MPQKNPNPTPLALQWLCFVRDHGLDLKVTQGERALASLLVTYGQGKNIFVSVVTLSKITGWSRNTVAKHRDGLIAKGLLEDITGDPDKQSRTYSLTAPGYVSEPAQNLSTPAQNLSTPAQNLSTPCSESEHNIKPLDQEIDQALTSSPARPVSDDAASDIPTEEEPDWTGNSELTTDNRAWLAKYLGVPVGSIGEPLWRWLEGLGLDAESSDYQAFRDAAAEASGARNPVGYFKAILPGFIEKYRAEPEGDVQDQEPSPWDTPSAGPSQADREAERKARIEAKLADSRRRREEEERLLDEYARRFHGGSTGRARRYVNEETGGWPAKFTPFIRDALDRAEAEDVPF